MSTTTATEAANGSLSDASVDRLACLLPPLDLGGRGDGAVRSLPRLRRVHQAVGEALRREQVAREIDSLDQ